MKLFLVALLGSSLRVADAHGALTVPTTRRGNGGYENDPVGFDTEAWVCRHAVRNEAVPLHAVTAGTPTEITWSFSAAHIGDCAVYISYDVALPLAEQKYFKIANLPKCKDQNRQAMPIDMPAWLPAGEAILRWDWYGIHQGPNNPEFYSQCVDIDITAGAAPAAQDSIIKYPIIGAYPRSGYRNGFGAGAAIDSPGFFMTGPACAEKDSVQNNCAMTKDNTLVDGTVVGGDPTGGGGGGGDPATPPDGGDTPAPPADDGATPPGCSPVLYTVKSGDTLVSIAEAHPEQQVDWVQICDANGLADCNQIEIGDELTIPCDVNLESAQSASGTGGSGDGMSGVIAAVIIAILVVGALIAFAIWKKKPSDIPPPPPPKGGSAATNDVQVSVQP